MDKLEYWRERESISQKSLEYAREQLAQLAITEQPIPKRLDAFVQFMEVQNATED